MLSTENQKALLQTLQDLTGFGILIIEAPVCEQGGVIAMLEEWGRTDPFVPSLTVGDASEGASVFDFICLAMHGVEGGLILHGLEEYATEKKLSALAGLNFGRDILPRKVHGPLVLVTDGPTLRVISERLPDFYSHRVFEVSVTTAV